MNMHRGRRFLQWLKGVLGMLPIIGHLAYCSRRQHGLAFKEFVITVTCATVTLWLTAVVLKFTDSRRGFWEHFWDFAATGEFYIVAMALLGSIFMVAADDPRKSEPFPGRIYHLGLLFSLAGVSIAAFAVSRVQPRPFPFFDQDFYFTVSLVTVGVTLLLYYLTLVYRNQIVDPEREIKAREGAFSEAYQARSVQP